MEIHDDAEIDINSDSIIIIRPKKDAAVKLNIGKNCNVNTYLIQEKEVSVTQENHVGEGSVLHSHCIWVAKGQGKIRNILEGKGSEAYDLHIFVEKEDFHLDTLLRHKEKNTKGNILVKGIVRNNGSAKLDGMIKIDKTGAGADSILTEHVMLLDPGAHATANPELEIENNDVSSTHAASVSQIDENKLFYLMSRGIPKDDAKNLIVEGFLESGVNHIKDEKMKKEFMKLISASQAH